MGNKTNKKSKDRRKSARHSCSLQINYASQELNFIDFISDVNCWGVFIQSDQNIPVGESVLMNIPLHGDEQSIKVIGEVMWTSPKGMGVKFNMGINTTMLNAILQKP
jgi:Tfp pilus assembly protein PilZ